MVHLAIPNTLTAATATVITGRYFYHHRRRRFRRASQGR